MTRAVENERDDRQTKATAEPKRNPGLKALDKLVGTWTVSGEASGELTYEWLDGRFFLIARGDFEQAGRRTKHMEIIGYDRTLGGETSDVMTSRLYTDQGDTLSYTHEIDEKGVTSWFGEKGSPSVFKARFSDDDTLTGAWEWPGGGYKLTLTRKGKRKAT
jgi:hypothetical protein